MQAVLVFVLSDICWCPTHPWNQNRGKDIQSDQCITTFKLLGFIGTVIGTLVYSFDGVLWGKDGSNDTAVQGYQKTRSCVENDETNGLLAVNFHGKPSLKTEYL